MLLLKIHRTYRNVVAVCDLDLLGRRFEEGKKQIEIKENFFNGDKIEKKEAIKIIERQIKEDATFNFVGKEAVKTALEMEIIEEEDIIFIQGVPLILIF